MEQTHRFATANNTVVSYLWSSGWKMNHPHLPLTVLSLIL